MDPRMEKRSRRRHDFMWALLGCGIFLVFFFVGVPFAIWGLTGSTNAVHATGYQIGLIAADFLLIGLGIIAVGLIVWGVVALIRRIF